MISPTDIRKAINEVPPGSFAVKCELRLQEGNFLPVINHSPENDSKRIEC